MAQRKLQQEIDKCFKNVDLGVESFDSLYDKYDQAGNAAQREKAVEALKTQCKKLQRLRDQIKQWGASSEVKDKGPLQDKRELIESKMEAFKAVEKEMKTKAFSKEGLLVSAKQDPREREKDDLRTFLGDMVDELARQIEESEAETEQLHAQSKKKKDSAKVERVAELESRVERHKWHQGKLEMLMRAMANDDVEPEQVKDAQEDIQHYVDNNREVDFFEDDGIYDDFELDEDADKYGMQNELEKMSSQDNQSVQEDNDAPPIAETAKPKAKTGPEGAAPARRPSQHIKSPLPALATLHNLPAATPATVNPPSTNMKPALPPSKPPGETLNYRSAAAAGAANDTAGIGIAPLPPPPNRPGAPANTIAPSAAQETKSSAASSPAVTMAQPAPTAPAESKASLPTYQQRPTSKSPAPSQSSVGLSPVVTAAQLAQASARDQAPTLPLQSSTSRPEPAKRETPIGQNHDRIASLASTSTAASSSTTASSVAQPNGTASHDPIQSPQQQEPQEDESFYHLPAALKDLVDAYEELSTNAPPFASPAHLTALDSSFAHRPDVFDSNKPRPYKPQSIAPYTPSHYPQYPLPVFNDPRLYSRVDQDALFYSFYYRQGTYQQYLAAKELKSTSWRFHKQYQTWFQRHEEPKEITEDFERGTYRFFDYESTWMNRRKADFEFKYRFLEDEML